jgi:hypothetical protein
LLREPVSRECLPLLPGERHDGDVPCVVEI